MPLTNTRRSKPENQVHTGKNVSFMVVAIAVLQITLTNLEVVQNEITQGLKEFFGIDREVKLEVSVKEYDLKKQLRKC